MNHEMEEGKCYLITTPPNGKHWFVVAFPVSGTRYLLFPFSTLRERSDQACILEPGPDTPDFIEHATVIGYRDAKELTQYAFEDAISRGHCTPAGEIAEDLWLHILRCGLTSRFLKNKWKTRIQERLGDSDS